MRLAANEKVLSQIRDSTFLMPTDYELDSDDNLRERQQRHDGSRLGMERDARAELRADDGSDADTKRRCDQYMTECEVTDDTDERGNRQDECAGGGRDMCGESKCVDHGRYVDNAAADAQYTGEKSCRHRRAHAERTVIGECIFIEDANGNEFFATIGK